MTRLGVAGTEQVAPAMEPAIKFRPSGRTQAGDLLHWAEQHQQVQVAGGEGADVGFQAKSSGITHT